MPQKVSLSSWNIGEISQTAIGDYEQEVYPASCRFLRNFVVSDTGKLWRRPGYEHHIKLNTSSEELKLIPYYHRASTSILVFSVTGTHPDLILQFDWYFLEDNGEGREKFVKQNATPFQLKNSYGTTFRQQDFEADRPTLFDINRLSWVQVDNYIYLTHLNMEDPWEIQFSGISFATRNFSTSDRSYYFDVWYDDATEGSERWIKEVQTDLTEGGGLADDGSDIGWQDYTGIKAADSEPNQGKNNGEPIQSFKYLTAVTFYMERLIWVGGPRVHGSGAGDPLSCGFQYNTSIPATIKIDPFNILASDPFMYRASSDLGYDTFQWVSSGPLLMGGANSGAWVLSNPQTRAIDTTNPLMFKATSNGAYWVPGKTVGDAILYFQRPGYRLNEFLFSNVSQNYVAANLTEYAGHLFYENTPREMNVQRSPFNAAMILREDGTMTSLTYHRQKKIAAWAQHPAANMTNPNVDDEGSKVISTTIFSDGVFDKLVVAVKRYNSTGSYIALEMMDNYIPDKVGGIFVDTAITQTMSGEASIISITPDENGYLINMGSDAISLSMGDVVNFIDAKRTDDGIQSVTSTDYDYIYGDWEVIYVQGNSFKIKAENGRSYEGIYKSYEDTGEANSYIDFGRVKKVTIHPSDDRFEPLRGLNCKALLDGQPIDIYVSKDFQKFYLSDSIPPGWEGDESELSDLNVHWNDIIIGRPYTSLFSPMVLKKQIHKGKLNRIEIETFRSLGGKVGIGEVSLGNDMNFIKEADIFYPVTFDDGELYTGTIKPDIVGGFEGDPLWYIRTDDPFPFNITNVTYELGAN